MDNRKTHGQNPEAPQKPLDKRFFSIFLHRRTWDWGQYPYPFTVMAEGHPPSPEREDGSIPFRRLRVKPAMTARSESPESKKERL
jgi:hypothetical protein